MVEGSLVETDLFGSAVKMHIPENYSDISRARILPDNQEVYIHEQEDKSLIVEICCYENNVPEEEVGQHYFYELSQDNESINDNLIFSRWETYNDKKYIILAGQQNVQKIGQNKYDKILIFMCIYRFKEYDADILISWNIPRESLELEPELGIFYEMIRNFKIVDFNLFI